MVTLTFLTLNEMSYTKDYESVNTFFAEISQYGFVTILSEGEYIMIPREQIVSISMPIPEEPTLP
jgi:hypothetical protein